MHDDIADIKYELKYATRSTLLDRYYREEVKKRWLNRLHLGSRLHYYVVVPRLAVSY